MEDNKTDTSPNSPSLSGRGLRGGAGKFYIIIVAGGTGKRMNTAVAKQFLLLQNKPILMHTIEKFYASVPDINIIVVLAQQLNKEWQELCNKYNFDVPHTLVSGGETRFHSVKAGLEHVPADCLVGVHDAARPLVSRETIINTFTIAEQKGNASPAISLNESIRKIDGNTNKAMDRNKYLIIQTPQIFYSNLLKKAFLQEYTPLFTDDASVVESIGETINLTEGNRENIKVTTPQDLVIAEALLKLN